MSDKQSIATMRGSLSREQIESMRRFHTGAGNLSYTVSEKMMMHALCDLALKGLDASEETAHAPREQTEAEYMERELLGDADKKTGVYVPSENAPKTDWEEVDRLDALGTFGARIIPYNGVWKIMLNETNSELWSRKTKEEAEAKLAEALRKSGYSDDENPLVELSKLKASIPSATRPSAWIANADRLPETHATVLATDMQITSTGFWTGHVWILDVNTDYDPHVFPTHWAPLPELPR